MATAATYFECSDCDIPEIAHWRHKSDYAIFGIAPAVAAIFSTIVGILVALRSPLF